MNEFEELKQYIKKATNYKFIFMLRQLTNENRAYEEIISDLELLKTDFFTKHYNNMQKLSFKNEQIDELMQSYKDKIIEKNNEIENLKITYNNLIRNKSTILNKLKDVLDSDTKANKILKCFLYHNNQNFREWIVSLNVMGLIDSNPLETKQRLNLLLKDEFAEHLKKRDYYLCDKEKITVTEKSVNKITDLILNYILRLDVGTEIRDRNNPYKNNTTPHGL